jgi:3D (Asp-Asp-Asp) domain-containing protein
MNLFKKIKKSANRRGVKSQILVITFCVSLLATFSSLAVTAKTTYIINDEDETIVVDSIHTDTASVLNQAGLTLSPEDECTYRSVDGDVEINIQRSNKVRLFYQGEEMEIETLAATVHDVLAEQGVSFDGDDIINQDLEAEVFDGMVITVDRVDYAYTNQTKILPHDTVEEEDDSIYEGETETRVEGSDGTETLTYRTTYINGVNKGTRLYDSVVTKEPVDTVIAVGTKQEPVYTAPVSGAGTAADGSFDYSYVLNMTATAYTTERQSNKITASGAVAQVGIVAADFSTLPMGTRVYITAADGSWTYGYAVVGDTGVTGSTIDLFYNTWDECINFGVRNALVYVLD